MKVFIIDLTLNLMLPHEILTHVTIHNSESIDSSIMNMLHTNTHVCDFEISTQRFRSSTVVDLMQKLKPSVTSNMDLISGRCLLSLKVIKPHKSHKSNSKVLKNVY